MGSALRPVPSDLLRAPVFSVEASVTMADGAPMVIDLDPKVLPEDQWIVEGISFLGNPKNAPATNDWLPPVSGLYLCPPGTPTETAFDAAFDLNFRSRPHAIPLDPYTGFRAIPGGLNAGSIRMCAQSGFQVSVPGGWFLRAILVLFPGGGEGIDHGPGDESIGKLAAMVRILRNNAFNGD